jgi:hypothetical protein
MLPDSPIVAPGQTARLQLTVDTMGIVGPLHETVRVISSDDQSPIQEITLTGVVYGGGIAITKGGRVQSTILGTRPHLSVTLDGAPDLPEWRPVGVSIVPRENPRAEPKACEFSAQALESDKAGRCYSMRISLPTESAAGSRRLILKVETDLEGQRSPTTILSYEVHPAIRSIPQRIYLGVVHPDEVKQARVRLLPARNRTAFSIRSATVRANAVLEPQFARHYEQDEHGWYVDVSYAAVRGQGRLVEASLVIETDDAGEPRLEVPIQASVPGG